MYARDASDQLAIEHRGASRLDRITPIRADRGRLGIRRSAIWRAPLPDSGHSVSAREAPDFFLAWRPTIWPRISPPGLAAVCTFTYSLWDRSIFT